MKYLYRSHILNVLWRVIVISAVSVLLAACGQFGPLYYPGEKSAYGPPYYSPLHPDDYAKQQKEKQAKQEQQKKQEKEEVQTETTTQQASSVVSKTDVNPTKSN